MTWDWSAFFQYLHAGFILQGLWVTIWLTAISMAIGIIIGLVAAALYATRNVVGRTIYLVYTTVIRGTPLLVQLVFAYTALPVLGINLTVAEAAILALSVNEGAYIAEIMRGAIESIPRGQSEAASATGLNYWQSMRTIIMPQAFRIVVPTIGNQVNGMFKNTSLVSVISMSELFRVTEEAIQTSFKVLELLAIASIYYLLLTGAWTLIQHWIELRLRIPGSRVESRRRRPAVPEGAV